MSDTSCPHCGAEKSCRSVCEIIEPTSPLYQAIPFWCGSNRDQSDLCREREAHNQTKRERDELLKEHSTLREIAEGAIMCASLWAGSRSSTPRKLREQLNQLNQIK